MKNKIAFFFISTYFDNNIFNISNLIKKAYDKEFYRTLNESINAIFD